VAAVQYSRHLHTNSTQYNRPHITITIHKPTTQCTKLNRSTHKSYNHIYSDTKWIGSHNFLRVVDEFLLAILARNDRPMLTQLGAAQLRKLLLNIFRCRRYRHVAGLSFPCTCLSLKRPPGFKYDPSLRFFPITVLVYLTMTRNFVTLSRQVFFRSA